MTRETHDGSARDLRLETFLCGKTSACGIFRDRFGSLRRQFQIEMNGVWDGETLTLSEVISYADGEIEKRTWLIKSLPGNEYEGHTDGMTGVARGVVRGSTFHWKYKIALEVGGRRLLTEFDDRMYLQDDHVLINCARVSKFGIRLGEVTAVFLKEPGLSKPADRMAGKDPASKAAGSTHV